ncbi:MAG: sigma-70 family RNA polymerase sigma factor [Planctomycetaceae bacterium]|nr:sigma-70 family RNA polymerase sigma factor [Planctomycetaceae bacterium]
MTPLADITCRDSLMPAASSHDADRCLAQREESRIHGDDLALVDQLLQRDAAAWKSFLQRYQRLIFSRVAAAGTELGQQFAEDTLEDACAEVLAALFRDDLAALRTYQGRSRLSTWLAVVARRVALACLVRHARGAGRSRQPGSDFDFDAVAAPAFQKLPEELSASQELLTACLQQLSATDREVLELHFHQGKSYDAIAAILGVSPNSVGPKLSRAQQRLRRLVERSRSRETTQRQGGRATP